MPESALAWISKTESGMVRLVMEVPQKASCPMDSSPEMRVMEVRNWQPRKALSPMVLMEPGRVMDFSPQHEEKVLEGISERPEPKLIEVKAVQPKKQ